MKAPLLLLAFCLRLIVSAATADDGKKIAWLDDTKLRIVSYNVFFASNFPGKIAVFTTGPGKIIMR